MKKSPTFGHTGAITKNCLQVVDAVKRNGRFKNYIDISNLLTGSPNTVTYWRNGKRAVTVEALGKLVELLNANPVYLLTGKGDLFNVASTDTLIERRLKALEQAVNELQNTTQK
jgi:transcriptional regulator with XRE-family HTH domain